MGTTFLAPSGGKAYLPLPGVAQGLALWARIFTIKKNQGKQSEAVNDIRQYLKKKSKKDKQNDLILGYFLKEVSRDKLRRHPRWFDFEIAVRDLTDELGESSGLYQTRAYGQHDPELSKAVRILGKKYALVIGINEYRDWKPLPYAIRDAKQIGRLLDERFGFEVEYLVTPQTTTKKAIEKAFDLLRDKVSDNDQVIVFFSGHGEQLKRKKVIMGGYFIPVNGRMHKPSTMIPMDRISELSRHIAARHALFIIDTCYSGIAGGTSSKGSIEEQTPEFLKAKLSKRGRQIMTAGKSEEEALQLDELRMSVYSYYLKTGLEGKADFIPDGVITMSEIQTYVEKKVSATTYGKQNPQYSDLLDTRGGEFVFVPEDMSSRGRKR